MKISVPQEYYSIIQNAAIKNNIPAILLASIIYHESGFNKNAVNINKDTGSKDRGIAQINDFAHPDVTDKQAFDPEFAINWAAAHLRKLRTPNGECASWFEVCLAYNGGMGAVYAYRRNKPYNLKYAESIKVLSEVEVIGKYCDEIINSCGALYKLDTFNKEKYHEIANAVRSIMGWELTEG